METSFVRPLFFLSLFPFLFFSFSGFLPRPLAGDRPHLFIPGVLIGQDQHHTRGLACLCDVSEPLACQV